MTTQTADAPATTRLNTATDAPRRAVIARPADGTAVRAFGNEILFKVTTEQSGGALSVGLAAVEPGGRVPLHVHGSDDEMFIIVEGTYRFCVDGTWTIVEAGSLVYLPRGVAHTFEVIGERTGRHWVIGTPGGFDRFYAECAEVFAAPGAPNVARLAAITAKYGHRIL